MGGALTLPHLPALATSLLTPCTRPLFRPWPRAKIATQVSIAIWIFAAGQHYSHKALVFEKVRKDFACACPLHVPP